MAPSVGSDGLARNDEVSLQCDGDDVSLQCGSIKNFKIRYLFSVMVMMYLFSVAASGISR